MYQRLPEIPGPPSRLAVFRQGADATLRALDGVPDHGLIHADLMPEAVLVAPDGLALLDFDDAGFGYRLFDIATAQIKNCAEPACPLIAAAQITGYRSLRALHTCHRLLFLALRATRSLGWIVPRIDEAGNPARCARFAIQAADMIDLWMDNR